VEVASFRVDHYPFSPLFGSSKAICDSEVNMRPYSQSETSIGVVLVWSHYE
jgi:hypothetical protein